ncbi:hypothetical protein FRC03_001243 [Tulasnella sp. 419]|nr:hypothetical protein FRC03_001243 [Tulasnella sp. 419]
MSRFIDEAIRITGFTTTNAHIGGTDRFMCPELLEDEPKSVATDVWALGCLILQAGFRSFSSEAFVLTILKILTDEAPYQHISRRQAVLSAIMRGEPPANNRNGIDERLWRCIKACWSIPPSDRPAVADIARCLNPPPCFLPSGDVLLLMLKSGLGVDEAIALEQTCRTLRLNAQTTQFWLAIASSLFGNRPLPLPPFYDSLLQLSHLEIKRVCLRHHKTTQNLCWSPSPKVMKHKTLVWSRKDAESSVSRLAFLPGGKYVIAIMSDGMFACWDYSTGPPIPDSDPNDPVAPSSHERLSNGLSANIPLATHHIGVKILDWSYQLLSDKREMLVAIVAIHPDFFGGSTFYVLRLSFSEEGSIRVDQVGRRRSHHEVSWKVYIRDNIVYGIYTSWDSVHLYLYDWVSKSACTLMSTVYESDHVFRGIPLCDNGLLIYRESGDEVHLYRYLDIPQLIRDHGSDVPVGDRTLEYQPTSFTRLLTGDGSPHGQGEFPGFAINVGGAVIHQQSNMVTGVNKPLSLTTIIARDMRLIYVTDKDKPRVIRRYSAFTHLCPPLLPTSTPSGDVRQEGRSIPIKNYCRSVDLAQDDFILGGNSSMTRLRLGSDGHHLLWIYGNKLNFGEVKLQLTAPSSPEEPLGAFHARSGVPIHDLQLGSKIDLDTATDIAMDDGHGIVGVATYRPGDKDSCIHILYY